MRPRLPYAATSFLLFALPALAAPPAIRLDQLGYAPGARKLAIVEGLVLALAPGHLRAALETIDRLDPERVRLIGLAGVALGVGLVWLVRA